MKSSSDTKRGTMPQIGVRLPPPVLERVDALVAERNAQAGYEQFNRSDVVRELVVRGLAAEEAKEAKEAAPKPKAAAGGRR